MTTFLPAYRLTLYVPRSVDPAEATILTPPGGAVHSDPFKVTTLPTLTGWKPYLGLPRGRTGRINALERTTDVGSMTFELFDVALVPGANAARWVSAFLGDPNGDPRLGGLKCFVEESLDGGTTWAAYWTGYVKALTLGSRGTYTITVRDLMYELSRLPLFDQPPHASITYAARPLLLPVGITAATYGTTPVAADLDGVVQSPIVLGGSTLANVARINLLSTSVAGRKDNFITADLVGAVAPNLRTKTGIFSALSALPNFTGTCRAHLTWNAGANQGDFKVGYVLQYVDKYGHAAVTAFMVQPLSNTADYGYAALPANGTAVTCRLFADYTAVAGAALFIDVANPLTLLADILAGKFSPLYRDPDTLPAGKAYGDVRRSFSTTISAATVPDLPPARFRVEAGVTDALKWTVENLLRPYGLALSCSGAGSFTVTDLRLPTSLAGLSTLTDADVAADAAAPKWEHDRDAAIFRTEGSLWEDLPLVGRDLAKNFADPYPTLQSLLLPAIEHPVYVLAIGSGDFGEKVWKMGGGGYRTMEGDDAVSGSSRAEYLQRRMVAQMNLMRRPYAHGETTTTLQCRRTATVAALGPGQVVQLAISTLPNPATGQRGGTRVCRVLEVTQEGVRATLRLLDLGVSTVAAAPTLGAPALGADPRHTATITVTLSADGPAEVRYAFTASGAGAAPADTDPAWHAWPLNPVYTTGAITLTELTPGLKLWVQARTFPDDRASLKLPSVWATSTGLVLTAYGVPSAVTATSITATTAKVSWTNGDTTLAVEVWLRSPDAGAYSRIAVLLPGSSFYSLWGLAPSTAYGLLVQYRSLTGVVSASASTSFSTTATATLPPQPPPLRRVLV